MKHGLILNHTQWQQGGKEGQTNSGPEVTAAYGGGGGGRGESTGGSYDVAGSVEQEVSISNPNTTTVSGSSHQLFINASEDAMKVSLSTSS